MKTTFYILLGCTRIILKLIISTKDLYKRIRKSRNQVIIVDTRSFSEYKNGHIPGAVNIDLFQLHWFDTSKRGIKDFNRQTRILLSNIGIKRETEVIFYDNVSGISAARGVWLLLYFSHKMVNMLDGGFEGWKIAGYPVEIKSNPLIHSEFKGKIDKNIISTAEEVTILIMASLKVRKNSQRSILKYQRIQRLLHIVKEDIGLLMLLWY